MLMSSGKIWFHLPKSVPDVSLPHPVPEAA
nr:MAG TPA: Enolase [Caudoviricetes sp.]